MSILQTHTTSQIQMTEFLAGRPLSVPVIETVLGDFEESSINYESLLRKVKTNLNANNILVSGGVVIVNYEPTHEVLEVELATLARVVNLRYKGEYVIALTTNQIVFIPDDVKNYYSDNDLIAEVTRVVKKVTKH